MPRNQRANSRSEFEHAGKFRIIRRDQAGVFESRALAETNGEDRRGVDETQISVEGTRGVIDGIHFHRPNADLSGNVGLPMQGVY